MIAELELVISYLNAIEFFQQNAKAREWVRKIYGIKIYNAKKDFIAFKLDVGKIFMRYNLDLCKMIEDFYRNQNGIYYVEYNNLSKMVDVYKLNSRKLSNYFRKK